MTRSNIKNACYAAGMAFGLLAACAAGARAADICSHIDTLRMTERVMPGREQVKPLFDVPLKDPSGCRGPDGWYYLTGTEAQDGKDFLNNDCIRIWKSKDLKSWELVGKALDMSLAVMKHPDDSPGGNRSWRRRPMAQPSIPDGKFVRGVVGHELLL